jgi:hypothetical protein
MNTFDLCTKRTPRRLGVHAWEKYLTVEEFQELSAYREAAERAEIQLEENFTVAQAQVLNSSDENSRQKLDLLPTIAIQINKYSR